MIEFKKPVIDVIRFTGNIIATSIDCNCDFGYGPMGDDEVCTGGTGEGGNIQCIVTDAQGNC